MGKKKQSKRATWFKFHLANKDLMLAMSDETLGQVVKMAITYFDNGDITDIDNLGIQDQLTKLAFTPFKQSCDEALQEYQNAVDFGKKGASGRWGTDKDNEDSPPIAPL